MGKFQVETDNAVIRTSLTRWKPRSRCLLLAATVVGLCAGNSLFGGTLPSGFTESLIAGGLANPTAMQFAPDGRLFVCQQNGQLRVIKNGVLLAAPFVTVNVDTDGERGLLGVAFDPGFESNHWIYVYYTSPTPAVHNRVSRFTASGDTAVAGSEVAILNLNNLLFASYIHNGGAIQFGSDGKLYIAVGDNGDSFNAQTLANLLGKMLRINADGTIPADNPFYNTASGANRAIWTLGLRNPFTFAVQPGTGRIFINDVGESTWEEINEGVAGANFGWPNCEGGCAPSNPSYRDPAFRYPHGGGSGEGNAITGGAFYNPQTVQFPVSYVGQYFFADYVNGWIRKLDPANGNQVSAFASGIDAPIDLKVGADGRLYYMARGSGSVFAISATASQAPQITQQPADQTVGIGQSATFTVAASGTPPLNYQWQRNGVDISGATAASYTLSSAGAGDDGAGFRCVVANAFGTATSNPAFLHISTNNPPAGTIALPTAGTRYSAGDTIQFAGTASDPEDGALPASAFSWTIVFHHNTHTHPFLGPTNGVTSGSFVIPTQGETSDNVWYRINLTVTDSGGQTQTSFVDVLPRTATFSLATIPPGLQVTLDGQPLTTPASDVGVVGVSRTLGVVSPQTLNGTNYEFVSWSDGGSATHVVATPATDTTYTATYRELPAPSGGLAAAYGFNEGTGTMVTDASGNGHGGALSGATWTPSGRYGGALSFNGSSSYVDLGNPPGLQLTGSKTWSAWVKAAANPPDDGQIVAKSDGTSGWQFKTSPDTGWHTFGVGVSGGGGNFGQRYSTTVRALNVWYHVAGVYDATAATLDIYVNGVLDNGVVLGTIPASQADANVNVNIGRRTGGFYFNGIIDEVRVYNRVLTAAEIQSDMNTPVGGT
ncbi:MAG TPA: PQQ-dependent sugar dehydrogenase, partial [Verrucomicrobiae bacterium]|nr:PQQ-dependent sugar dehydrogenase [Verrucomicrobiae bacterium]